MGRFFGNVHVQLGDAAGVPKLTDAIGRFVMAQGYVAADATESADRSIVLAPSPDHRWVSIYDEEAGPDLAALERLADNLSGATRSVAFAAMVHDSDTLFLSLFQNGRCADRYVSGPGEPATQGNAARWEVVASGEENRRRLRTIWDSEETFVEAKLGPLARILGIPAKNLFAGFEEAGNRRVGRQ